MLQTIIAPNVGHPLVYHFCEGAAVWGSCFTPSIAHFVQSAQTIEVEYSRTGAGVLFQHVVGQGSFAHVIDEQSLRLQIEGKPFRNAAGGSQGGTEARLVHHIGSDCWLKLWGHVSAGGLSADVSDTDIISIFFRLAFWEIGRPVHDDVVPQQIAERDKRIRELEAKVALSMSSQ